ncbi:hypothetical protein BDA99DRAFT_566931 [Phascolomyces articulosus]|uniref:Uncharacterized protein n=1 Tax=Phascolomyces articulosus TaxID=60185 RepID=A0AAD5JJU5_9FUNG|nr:hypothetical protein BDA99DRAFT_566931 [Phascolomyces articulosus]
MSPKEITKQPSNSNEVQTSPNLTSQPAPAITNILPTTQEALTKKIQGAVVRNLSKPIHNSLDLFISAFEHQLKSHNLPLDDHCEHLFWVCLNDDQIP